MSNDFNRLVDQARLGGHPTATECARAARELRAAAWAEARERHRQGASGETVLRALSEAADVIVQGAAEAGAANAGPRDDLFQRVAVCALGGYGRNELNPSSDLDVCLLYTGEMTPDIANLNEFLVPFFWDAGFDAAYLLSSADEAVGLASEDTSTLTTYLLSRVVWGNPDVLGSVRAAISVADATRRGCIATCAQRGYRRHLARDYSDRFARQPNLKEQAGGLRDYHAALWMLALAYGPAPLESLAARGIFSSESLVELNEGLDFLWRVRNELHFYRGRRDDVLTIANQKHVAAEFDYGPDAARAIERFMEDYYAATSRVREFLRATIALCTHEEADPGDAAEPEAGQITRHRAQVCAGMHDKRWFAEHPARLMQVFWESARGGGSVSRATLDRVRANLHLVTPDFQRSDLVRRLFFGICSRPLEAGRVLRQMAECGLLGAYLPEFGAVRGIVRYEAFHSFPVDEHTLRAIEAIAAIPSLGGNIGNFLERALEHVREPHLLVLAILFHDLGKVSGEEHVEEGVALARVAGQRMGWTADVIERIAFLVRHHMLMIDVAMYRDTDDPGVVSTFAETMRSDERLRELLVMSHCDLKAVGPAVWTEWKGALLMKLHLKTERFLSGRDMGLEADHWRLPRMAGIEEALRYSTPKKQHPGLDALIRRHLDAFGERYLIAFHDAEIARHIQAMQEIEDDAFVMWHNVHEETAQSEVTIITRDRPGLFATLAGAFSANNAAIRSAGLFTTESGYVIDFFHASDARESRALTNAQFDAVRRVVAEVLIHGKNIHEFVAASRSRLFAILRPAAPVATHVTFDDLSSPTDTVVDIETGDRTGLLYDIAAVFAAMGVDVLSARINTDDFRVRDAFHIALGGAKIENPAIRQDMQDRLRAALEPLVMEHT
ncbi:MAG: [protein-PII] uridylyltransferase [Candidatus Hydrogenedens sp.]|nr:[protein-PII] uridylyltransferase [Candidatus Hydrogenedens sp.]